MNLKWRLCWSLCWLPVILYRAGVCIAMLWSERPDKNKYVNEKLRCDMYEDSFLAYDLACRENKNYLTEYELRIIPLFHIIVAVL